MGGFLPGNLQAVQAKLPDPALPSAGASGEGLWAEAERGTELTHPSAATFFFDVLMFQFWHPVRQRHQAACPSSLLTPEQLLAGLSGDFKGGKLPWDSFSKAPSQCERCEGRREIKVGPTFGYGENDGQACLLLSTGRGRALGAVRSPRCQNQRADLLFPPVPASGDNQGLC